MPENNKKMVQYSKLSTAFVHFVPFFGQIFDDFFSRLSHLPTGMAKEFSKNEEKPCSDCLS